jgi:predicted RNA-binding Zn-ribbon protein involved in translation (DUF1610 family)
MTEKLSSQKKGKRDHEFTDEIVCPWCGHEISDSWEVEADDGDYECPECGNEFCYCREVSVTYSTSKK